MIALDLTDVRAALSNVFNRHLRVWAGAAFVALAMISIQDEEVIAPSVTRITDVWTSTTAKLTNLSL